MWPPRAPIGCLQWFLMTSTGWGSDLYCPVCTLWFVHVKSQWLDLAHMYAVCICNSNHPSQHGPMEQSWLPDLFLCIALVCSPLACSVVPSQIPHQSSPSSETIVAVILHGPLCLCFLSHCFGFGNFFRIFFLWNHTHTYLAGTAGPSLLVFLYSDMTVLYC